MPLSGSITWVLDGCLVVIAATLLTFGRLADALGRGRVLLGGLAVFTLGSALCGAAPSLYPLVAARCFRALGAAAIFSVNIAMVTRAFPAEDRGRALGLNLVVVALGIAVGPTVGGLDEQSGLALDLLRERARRCGGDPHGMEGAHRAPAHAPSSVRSPGRGAPRHRPRGRDARPVVRSGMGMDLAAIPGCAGLRVRAGRGGFRRTEGLPHPA